MRIMLVAVVLAMSVSGCASMRKLTNRNLQDPPPPMTQAQYDYQQARNAHMARSIGAAGQGMQSAMQQPARPMRMDCKQNQFWPYQQQCVQVPY